MDIPGSLVVNETRTRIVGKGVDILSLTAPVDPALAWEIESFLLRIFEYGDYSFRSALSGEYSKTLDCTFFIAKHKHTVIGAAGCLYARRSRPIAIVGPVAVAAEYRRTGIGTKLVESVIDHLRIRGCMAAYLGVSQNNSAARLYEAIGFERYQGIVMRFLMCPEEQFDKDCFGTCADVRVRRATWGDFPGVHSLVSFPCRMFTVDLRRGLFSSKYIEPTRFLSVFPDMMEAFARHGGFANVLVAGREENVVAFAHLSVLAGKARRHVAELDFYVHDNFVEQAGSLVDTTISESNCLTVDRINCYCLDCDGIKRSIIKALGGVEIAVLPRNIVLDDRYQDIIVYQLRRDI
jgi:GNAT superfamily N-acetyltransferase